MCVPLCVHAFTRAKSWMPCSFGFCFIALRHGLSQSHELAIWLDWLDNKLADLPVFVPQCLDYRHVQSFLAFYLGAGDLNSGPYAQEVPSFPEPGPQPSVLFLKRYLSTEFRLFRGQFPTLCVNHEVNCL